MTGHPDGLSRVLVTGATGFLGARLVASLVRDRVAVRALVRPGTRSESLEASGVVVHRGDLRDPGSLRGVADGVTTVYHLASVIGDDPTIADEMTAVNGEGTRALLDELPAGVRRVVVTSSIAVYGGGDLIDVDETAPRVVGNAYGQSKILQEDIVTEAARDGRFEAVLLRPCQVYGPGDHAFLPRVRALVENPDLLILGDGSVPLDLVHVDDVVRALRLAGESAKAVGGALNVTSGERLSIQEILDSFRDRLGRPPRRIRDIDSGEAARRIARLERRLATRAAGPPRRFFPLALRDITRARHFDISRARRVLGYEPRVRLRDGLSILRIRRGRRD